MNCAPALSNDGGTLYIAVNTASPRRDAAGRPARTRQHDARDAREGRLTDPNLGTPARISDDGTAAPVVGPDGRVFYGVLEAQFATHNARGWLLQFDSLLNPAGSRAASGGTCRPA
jgi:hypothetical protein